MSSEAFLQALERLAGTGNVLKPGEQSTSTYERGARNDHGRAAFVVRPASTAEVSAVVSLAVRNQVSLVPQSGNTGLAGGSIPDQSGTQGVLSLDRMKRILSVDRSNRTADVEAGVRLSQLNQAVSADGLFFPIELGADPMIGGMVATNTGGAKFLRYGDVRRNTLGLEVVLPDENGTILDLSTALRKNNAGVDLKQIFIGTSGFYGVVTRATVELRRPPKQVAAALLVPRDDTAVLELLEAFEDYAGDLLSAFEGMSKEAMQAAFDHVPSLKNPFPGGALPDQAILVELTRTSAPREGEQALESLLECILYDIWDRRDTPLANALIGRPETLWSLRHALSEGAKAAGQMIGFDLSFPRSSLPRFRAEMRSFLAETHPTLRVCDFGHVGDGGLHFNCVHPVVDGQKLSPSAVFDLRSTVIQQVVSRFSGSYSAEHGIGPYNQAFYDKYSPEDVRDVARRLKEALHFRSVGTGAE